MAVHERGEEPRARQPGRRWPIDQFLLDRQGNDEIQLALFLSYGSNPPLYPRWQEYFRKHQPPTLIVWGKNDKIFPPAGAEPYKRDLKTLEFHLLDAGHFALEDERGRDRRADAGLPRQARQAREVSPCMFAAGSRWAGGSAARGDRHALRLHRHPRRRGAGRPPSRCSSTLVTTYASETNKTASMWRAVPDDLLDFRPHEKMNTIRTILVHQLLSERRFFAQFVGTDEPPVEELLPAGETPAGRGVHRQVRLAGEGGGCRSSRPATTAWWLEERPFFGGLVRQRIWVFWRRVLHTCHHRTQVQTWLRLAGCARPGDLRPVRRRDLGRGRPDVLAWQRPTAPAK